MKSPLYKTLEGHEAVAACANALSDAVVDLSQDPLPAGGASVPALLEILKKRGLVSFFSGAEDAAALAPALRKAREEGLPLVLHVETDDPADLLPLAAQDMILIASSTAQEASDMAALATLLARATGQPVLHFYDRRWVGGEFAKIDVWDAESLDCFKSSLRPEKLAPSDCFSELARALQTLTGRAYAAFDYVAGAAEPESAAVKLALDAPSAGSVRVRLWRPFAARPFLECLPSSVKSFEVEKVLNAEVLSALHQGIVGGWSWFVSLPPILPLEVSAAAPESVFGAVIRMTDLPNDSRDIETAVREMAGDLAGHSSSFFQIYSIETAGGRELHVRIGKEPIASRGPIDSPGVLLTVNGGAISWTGGRASAGSLDAGLIARNSGLGERLGPVTVSVLLFLMDCESILGVPEGHVRDLLYEAVQDRWSDFSEDIVTAHRRAMEAARREMLHPQQTAPNASEKIPRTGPVKRAPARPVLETDYWGFRLQTPFIACVSEQASEEDRRVLAESPVGAVFFGPVLEKELDREAWKTFSVLHQGARPLGAQARPPLERRVEALKIWKDSVECPVIVGLQAASEKNWLAMAFALEQSGADALELILEAPEEGGPFDPLRIVSLVSGAVRIPVGIRITPTHASLAERGRELAESGGKGLVLFQRPVGELPHPDDLEPREEILLDGDAAFRLALPAISRVSSLWPIDLAAVGPVSASGDVLSALLAGSRAVYVTPDPDNLRRLEETLKAWMEAKGFSSVDLIRLPRERGQARRRVVE